MQLQFLAFFGDLREKKATAGIRGISIFQTVSACKTTYLDKELHTVGAEVDENSPPTLTLDRIRFWLESAGAEFHLTRMNFH